MPSQPLAVTTREAAELLGVSRRTLEGLRVRGGGPPFSRVGGRVVYRIKTLEQYLAARERRSTAEQLPGAVAG